MLIFTQLYKAHPRFELKLIRNDYVNSAYTDKKSKTPSQDIIHIYIYTESSGSVYTKSSFRFLNMKKSLRTEALCNNKKIVEFDLKP